MEEIIDSLETEKETVLKLIQLDNKINHSNIKYNDLYELLVNTKKLPIKAEENILFITEGEPIYTIAILKTILKSKMKYILFINQKYLGINKWLIARYNESVGFLQIYLDCGDNYNKYLKAKVKVIPLGDKVFIEEIYNDFYNKSKD